MVSSTKFVLSMALSLCSIAQGYLITIDFHQGEIKTFDVPYGNLTADDLLQNPCTVLFGRESSVDKRQGAGPGGCTTDTSYYYELIGDGDPHQNYRIGQIANTLVSCPGTVATGESHTFGWSFSFGLNPGYMQTDFASLGFSVSESNTETVTDSFECAEDTTEICAFHYTAVTAVSVTFYQEDWTCGSVVKTNLGAGTVWLPNTNGIGSTISRGTNFGIETSSSAVDKQSACFISTADLRVGQNGLIPTNTGHGLMRTWAHLSRQTARFLLRL